MSGTLDVKGVDKWAVCSVQRWTEGNLGVPVPARQSAGNKNTNDLFGLFGL